MKKIISFLLLTFFLISFFKSSYASTDTNTNTNTNTNTDIFINNKNEAKNTTELEIHDTSNNSHQKLFSEVFEFQKKWRLPSIVISIVEDGKQVWTKGLGLKDALFKNSDTSNRNSKNIKNNNATLNTIYRIASLSKPIAAMAIMKLYEDGKIDLNEKCSKYLNKYFNSSNSNYKEIPENLKNITVYQVLTHTSGIRHYDYEKGEKENDKPITDPCDSMCMYGVLEEQLLFPPSCGYCYSSYAYNLLQYIIESVSGESYMQFLQKNIFNPANMTKSGLDHPVEGIQLEAIPYRLNENLNSTSNFESSCQQYVEAPAIDVRWKKSGGGIASTVNDLSKFAMALDNLKILKAETLTKVYTSAKLPDGNLTQYGIGWHIFPVSDDKNDDNFWVGHGGGATGGSSYLLRNPKKKIAISILTNLQIRPSFLGMLANRLAQVLYPNIPTFKIGSDAKK
ncbi:MAG: beta-lactamase family protein [Oligoflexia bacterium]|nr:beta-lactamase family protein [Oligoflexia bacterium]